MSEALPGEIVARPRDPVAVDRDRIKALPDRERGFVAVAPAPHVDEALGELVDPFLNRFALSAG